MEGSQSRGGQMGGNQMEGYGGGGGGGGGGEFGAGGGEFGMCRELLPVMDELL